MSGHLIHIGYPKAGSKFLQRWFAEHPQLAFEDGGIAGFRNVYAIIRGGGAPRPGVHYRVTSYEGLVAPQASAGEDFVDYASSRDDDMPASQSKLCAALAELFPNARILIVTRGFRAMILSSYSQYVRSGGDADLDDLVAAALTDHAPGFDALLRLNPWNYDHVIDIYSRAFGPGNVIVVPYELLRDDAGAFTNCIEERLGLTHFPALGGRLNRSLSGAEMYWYPRLARLIRRLPIGTRLRRGALRLHVRAAMADRLRGPIALLGRWKKASAVSSSAVTDELLATFRGNAERLRGNPLYAPYACDYLL